VDKHGLSGLETVALLRRTDDFSEQFSTPDDPRFWIRFEAPLGDTVTVTDLLFGALDEYQMAATFGHALELIGQRKPQEFLFRDLGAVDAPATARAAARVERMLEAWVMRQRRFIVGRAFEFRDDKVDLRITLKTFD